MTLTRIFNFGAGPAVLPTAVLEHAQRELLALPGVGMSVLEISHRSPHFDRILQETEAELREIAGIPPQFRVLFLQGGASLQFAMVPMNLLDAGGVADYLVTGGLVPEGGQGGPEDRAGAGRRVGRGRGFRERAIGQ